METSCETLYKPLFPLVTFLSGKEVQAGEKSCPAAFRSHARLWLCLAGRGAEMVDIHPDTPDELIRRFSDDRHKFFSTYGENCSMGLWERRRGRPEANRSPLLGNRHRLERRGRVIPYQVPGMPNSCRLIHKSS